MDYNLADS